MARGGARPGSGRKPGSLDKIAKNEKVLKAVEEKFAGIFSEDINTMSPLEIMLVAAKISAEAGDWAEASTRAALAAPYIHPKLSSSEVKQTIVDETKAKTTKERAANVFGPALKPLEDKPGTNASH
jgi:hypothetical protein